MIEALQDFVSITVCPQQLQNGAATPFCACVRDSLAAPRLLAAVSSSSEASTRVSVMRLHPTGGTAGVGKYTAVRPVLSASMTCTVAVVPRAWPVRLW